MNFEIIKASTRDYAALGQVMYDAVRQGESPYTDDQRAVWMTEPRSGEIWDKRLSEQIVLKAVTNDTKTVAGFMSLRPDGYVDFAYILPSARGQGLFRALYNVVEAKAKALSLSELQTHASLMAQPAFSAMGFAVVEKESVTIGHEQLERYLMTKSI